MKKIAKKLIFLFSASILFLLIINLFFIRLVSPKEIDDISPEISCEENYIQKSEILWIIPFYNNKSISEDKKWCESILSLNKTLGLHGVYHTYEEFEIDRNSEYLQKGINSFENCFGFRPKLFKPPQLKISNNNKQLIQNNNMTLKAKFNQIISKVYHCNNTGLLSNGFVDLF